MFKRPLAILFALVFSACVLWLDFTAGGPPRILGLYGWAAVVFAGVLLATAVRSWLTTRNLVPPGIFRPREAVFFIAGLVAAASLADRATASLPLAHAYRTLPGWPPFYLLLFLVIVGAGAYFWLGGRGLGPWGLFSLLALAGVNGQLFDLAGGGYGVFFGFTAVVFFFQGDSLADGKPRLSYVGTALLIFIVASFASLLWSQDWGGSFRAVFFLTNGFLVFVILAREIEAADVLALPGAVVWALVLTGISLEAALVAKFVMVHRWIPFGIPSGDLFWTMGISRNALNTYFVAALPLLLLAAKSPRPAAPRWLLWIQVAFSVAVPALTLSKSGILGLLVVLWFAFAFWGTERRMNLKLLASGAVLVLVVAVLTVGLILPGGPSRFFKPLAYTAPLVTFKVAGEALRLHALTGLGLGSRLAWVAQAGALSTEELVTTPALLTGQGQSLPLEVAGAMGLVGLVAFFIVVQTAAWAGVTLVKVDADRFFFGMISASLAGAAAILAVTSALASLAPIPIILFVGLAMYEGGVRRRGLPATSPPGLVVAFTVLVITGAALGLMSTASGHEAARGEALAKEGNFAEARRCLRRAAWWAPWDAVPHSLRAACLLADPAGDLREAYGEYRAATRRARGDASSWERLGLLAWHFAEEERAADYLARAIKADPAGLLGGEHQVSYALWLAARGETSAARRLLTAAAAVDPELCRSAAFVVGDRAGPARVYLRAVSEAGEPRLSERMLFALLEVRGYGARSLPGLSAEAPTPYTRDLCLEDIYAVEFRRSFNLKRAEGRVAPAPAYRFGEGYAETRRRAKALFVEAAATPGLAAADADVRLALFPSPRPEVEAHRPELQSLLGMALLAHGLGENAALPELVAELRVRAVEVRRDAGGEAAAREGRLYYYYLTEESAAGDIELAEALLARGDASGARRYYERALDVLLAEGVDAREARLPAAVKGILQSRALVGLGGGEAGRPGLPYSRAALPAAYAARAYAEEFFGEYKNALVTLRKGLARYPRDAGLRVLLAEYYERRGRPARALRVLEADEAPRDLALWRARAEARARYRGPAESLKWLAEVEAEYPGDLVTYLTAARVYLAAGDVEGGLAVLERARREVPTGSLWASRYAAVLLAAGEGEAAAACYARAREMNPFDLEPYVVWGEELCRRGRPEEALPWLEAAVAVDPDSTWARRALGACYERLGRYGEAEATYREGVAREGPGSPLTLTFDDYFHRRGEVAGRRRVLRAAVRRDPANAALRERLGEIALAEGDVEGGLALLREALALAPSSPEANAAVGFHYRTHGAAAEAVPYFERARAAAPGRDKYRVLLADALIETGRFREALAELEPVKEPGRLPKALALRAKAYYNLGEEEEASAAARHALELDPGMTEAAEFVSE